MYKTGLTWRVEDDNGIQHFNTRALKELSTTIFILDQHSRVVKTYRLLLCSCMYGDTWLEGGGRLQGFEAYMSFDGDDYGEDDEEGGPPSPSKQIALKMPRSKGKGVELKGANKSSKKGANCKKRWAHQLMLPLMSSLCRLSCRQSTLFSYIGHVPSSLYCEEKIGEKTVSGGTLRFNRSPGLSYFLHQNLSSRYGT
jgi:hypothetical protein